MTPAPLLQNTTFGPDEIVVFVAAFEGALRQMDLVDRADPATEMVARKTIELARHRERDAVRLRERVVKAMSGPPPDAESHTGTRSS
jgi:hypothetical protein